MAFPTDDFAQIQSEEFTQVRFSTAQVPPARRIPLWHEIFGRTVTRRMIVQTAEDACHVDLSATYLARSQDAPGVGGGVCIQRMRLSGGTKAQRTRDLLSDGNGDLVLHVQLSGQRVLAQNGRRAFTRAGESLLSSNADISTFEMPGANRFVSIGLPRALMAAKVPGIEDAVARPLPDRTGSFALLIKYLALIADGEELPTPELRRAAASHIQDLCALAIGAAGDDAAMATRRGLRAARLASIKDDIRRHLGDVDLSATTLALRHGITPRYVHRLFESEGVTLSRFVLGQRLAQIYRLLDNPRHADRRVSELAYSTGFSDLSTFNREFRRRFGATPSEVRAASGIARGGRHRR